MKDEVYMFDEAAKLKLTKYELGGKGYGLVEMTGIGLNVPRGFVITTRMCNKFFEEKKLWPSIKTQILSKMSRLEQETGKKFGSAENPLLVSVRSGAPFSMPGMMDTVLNLGMNDEIAEALSKRTTEKFAYDTYRRFVQLFSTIVLKIERQRFDAALDEVKKEFGARSDAELSGEGWKKVTEKYKAIVREATGSDIPKDPVRQLFMAIGAVFASWWNKRAMEYRKIYKIPDSLGTAVNVVSMVYGNYDANSGTGVAFTRDPSTGEKKLYAEVLMLAQGEDVVAGIRTPMPASELAKRLPSVYKELVRTTGILERHFRDMQDIEFTIESGKFYLLQTRNGKRTPAAAIKIATDMVGERLITKEEAIGRVEPEQLEALFHKRIDPKETAKPIAKGLPAAPGAATGTVAFTNEDAVELKKRGNSVILIRQETTPEDITGIAASDGVLTSRGGVTSHAAVVTRGMGKPCIVGAEEIKINTEGRYLVVGSVKVSANSKITIDGTAGNVYVGELKLIEPTITQSTKKLLGWADQIRRLGIRANADTPEMVAKAMENGAEGIGLARTERMFTSQDRLKVVRKMILADSEDERRRQLALIKPMQKHDFEGMFALARGKPITIRLLDAPLHEFLPKAEELIPRIIALKEKNPKSEELAEKEKIFKRVMELRESNPMMGQRGVRLALMHKEIYEMQVEAILEAALDLKKKGVNVKPEIMVSQVAIADEFAMAKRIITDTAERVFKEKKMRIAYKIGTMIETPRAALTAEELARHAEFFSFGTNDLTQGTLAFSRDDAEAKFLPFYIDNKLLPNDPFSSVDKNGVGRLMELCTREGKTANKELKVGVCGEHGGDPNSIIFFHGIGIDYVSMSPYRVPVARFAAAKAVVSSRSSTTA
ncbi:MAG: pyruvate, phosphate dikinase [Candidatus Micrarchaeia archaeon]